MKTNPLSFYLNGIESGSRPRGGAARDSGSIPSLGGEHITSSGEFDFTNVKTIPDDYFKSLKSGRIQKGDILIVKDGATTGKAALVGAEFPFQQAAINEHVFRLDIDRAKASPSFIFHFLRSAKGQKEILKNFRGAAIGGINRTFIDRVAVPDLTLDEQKRIAAVLDKTYALGRHRQESLDLTEKLLRSIFIDMFVRNNDAAEWTRRSVDWMANHSQGSIRTGPFGSQLLHSEFVDRGIAVLGIDNAVKNRFVWGRPRFITPEKYQRLKRYKVFPGDLIITIMGTLGRCAIVPDDIPESINTKHLCCITLDHAKCLPEFLHAGFLNHPDVLRQLGVRTKGAVMPGLNMGIIKDLKLPLPPIELQKEFKRVVNLCTSSRNVLEDSKNGTDDLFGSLQQRAFRGEWDLSQLKLDEQAETSAFTPEPLFSVFQSRYKRPGSFIAPPDIEARMMALEYKLDTYPNESIQWSEDYFKYRTLSQVLEPPFSFTDIWKAVEHDIEEPKYETVKDKIFEYVAAEILEQRFDEERKEIVFHPGK